MDLELAVCYTLIRVGIPILLLFVVCIRQNLFSGIYLVHLLVGPFLPYSSGRSLTKGNVGIYLKILIISSALICVAQVVFQIILLVSPAEYRSTLDYCSFHGLLLNSIGLNRLDDVSFFEILRLIALDFVVFFFSSAVFLVTENVYEKWAERLAARRAANRRNSNPQVRRNANRDENRLDRGDSTVEAQESSTTGPSTSNTSNTVRESQLFNGQGSTVDGNMDIKDLQRVERYRQRRQKALETIKLVSEIIFVSLLCGSGILNPSLTSSIYFISFLSIVTLVSCNKKLGNFYAKFKLFLCLILICHLTALFLYQMDWFRTNVPETSLWVRLFGLRPYVKVNCTSARELHFENFNWNIYAHPFFLVILYVFAGSFVRAEIFQRAKVVHKKPRCLTIGSPLTLAINCDLQHTSPSELISMNYVKHNFNFLNNTKKSSINTIYSNSSNIIVKLNDLVEEESEVVGYTMPLHDLAPFKTESTPLLSGTEPKRYQALQEQPSIPRTGLEMDPHGSLTWRNDLVDGASVTSSVQKTTVQTGPTSPNPTTVDRSLRWAPIFYLMNLIKRGSYALTLIVMMTWSITYHSWLGFTLLLWSCVIWMMPNSRQACLKSSFCLVIYAILLLLSQYIFSLDLREDELPQFIGTINLSEIGLKKYFDMSYKPLALKTLFTCMFWITLRQYSEEQTLARWNQERDRSMSTNRGGQGRPSFQRHMSLASAVLPQVSPTLLLLSNFIRGLFIKYWIWVVAIMLMVMSLGGDRVVIYRIAYMSLFLSFIFVFQLSFKLWRKFMYPFWLVVIIYSMTVLIAIYTYQFQNFARYWQDYLRTSKEMQEALGLKLYGADPWVLFKELFTPTFFLIITIIQLRFWHKDFLLFTRCDIIPERREVSSASTSSTTPAAPSNAASTSTDLPKDIKIEIDSDTATSSTTKYTPSKSGASQAASSATKSGKTSRTMTTTRASDDCIESILLRSETKKKRIPRLSVSFLSSKLRSFQAAIGPAMHFFLQLIWRLLEIHLNKIVLLVSTIAALKEVSLVNIAFIVLISIAISLTKFEKFILYLIDSWASVLILTKMVYQLPTVYSSTTWLSNCTSDPYSNSSFPISGPIDNRLYIGFKEVENNQVFNYIKLDLFVTLMLTINSIVAIRQQIHRQRKNIRPLPPGIAISGVKRQDAEKGFFGLARYLINFGFYKFGLEITCFMIVIAIQYRKDIVSCVYSVALIIFTMCPRRVINRLWPYFLGFLCVFLPIEYISCVGLPPGFCLNYPWESSSSYFQICREWLFLPDFIKPPDAHKLFYDFFVLFLAGRQYLVFKIERRPDPFNYEGGDNIDMGSEACTHNPDIEDFFTFTNTIFDHIRSLFFTTFVWLTLAIVFLTAMSPDNLFGVGYIIGCFIFLWMGSDIYLRQQRNIVLAWKILIFYNLFVILSKTILQIIGCAYQRELLGSYCWAVQLMGIVCDRGIIEPGPVKYDCVIDPRDRVQLTMDCLCFCFLLMQKRIFGSHYFKFLVKEIWAQTTLASRGAQLIHEVQLKEVREQENAEREVMEKIKAKMDRIRANQQASLGARSSSKINKIKYHYQEDYRDYDVSPYYSTAEGTFPHTPEPQETPPSTTLPTVYSPTPSLPTLMSPSSAASHAEGKGYLEIFRIPYSPRFIDALSSGPTVPSFSPNSSPFEEGSTPYTSISTGPSKVGVGPGSGSGEDNRQNLTFPPSESIPRDAAIVSRPSFRVHQKPHQPLSRISSVHRHHSLRSSVAASHGSSIKSGDYYMFDEPDLEVIDFNEKTRRPQIPDPVGDELDRIATFHGVTAFCSSLIKGQSAQSEIEQRKKLEDKTDVGESSKDSAIISVDREREIDRESSATTQFSSLPPTSTIPESPESEGSSTLAVDSESDDLPKDEDKFEETESEVASDDGQCESIIRKIEWWCKLTVLFFKSLVISLTAKLNSVSRDYRFVSRRLEIERKALKRLIIDDDYDRDPDLQRETLELISKASYTDLNRISNSPRPILIREELFISIVPREDNEAPSEDKLTTPDSFLEANFFVRFLWSLFYAIISHSEFLCYFLVILNQLINASLLSMPLPLMVFLWGCLSVPRPTRTFWLYVITYTELVIITKYMFSFKVWKWMSGPVDNDPFWPPTLFGVVDIDPSTHQIREGSKSKMDLLLLLALFFHRFMLKSLGLWDLDENFELARESSRGQNREVASASGASRDELSKEVKIAPIKYRKESETILRRRNLEDLSHSDETQRYQDDDPLSNFVIPDDKEIEMVQKLIEASENMHKKCWATVSPIRQFIRRILSPPFRIAKDYYAMMFFCDFINFFTVWFGYSSFGTSPGVGDITTYLQENRVPMPFLFMLLFQFGLIIIDRGLYLRKDVKKRLIFHIVIAIAMHIFLFIALPAITSRSFTDPDNNAPKLWYVCKSIYLLLSAWQIKSGYPTRILGNCFTKKYTFVNSTLFMLYMMVPFLYDMRLMMDWMWTDTSLGLNEWAIMEDINKQLFERKCELTFEENFPEPGAISRRRVPKYIRGGAYLLLMIGAIWFPLFIFALSGTIGQPNKPSDFSIEIEFSGYQPIFKMSSTNDALEPFKTETYNALEQLCTQKKWVGGQNLLSTYSYADAVKAKINGNSTAVWGISPPSQRSLITALKSDMPILVKITYSITRAAKSKTQNLDPSIYNYHTIEITKDDEQLRNALVEMLRHPEDPVDEDEIISYNANGPAILRKIFPNYLKAPESGMPEALEDFGQTYRDVAIILRKGRFENGSITQWWEISEANCTNDPEHDPFAYFGDGGEHCRYLTSVIFSDKIFPGPLLQLISGHGIFGLYTTFVFVVSRIIRSFFADMCTKVIYTQMPCVDRVLQLCLDIYLVRESREFGLEEDLYAKLIFLYRSPETLIKWTKPIEPPSLPPPAFQTPNVEPVKEEDKSVDEQSDA